MKWVILLLFIVVSGGTYILKATHCNQTTCEDDIIRSGVLTETDCNIADPIACNPGSGTEFATSTRCIENANALNFTLVFVQVYQVGAIDCTGPMIQSSIARMDICDNHAKLLYNTTHITLYRFAKSDYACNEEPTVQVSYAENECILSNDPNIAPLRFTYLIE